MWGTTCPRRSTSVWAGSLGSEPGFIDWIEHARPVNDVPDALLRVVRRYQTERRADEPFFNWARRVPNDDLRRTLAEDGTGTPVTLAAARTPSAKGPATKKAPAAKTAPAAKKAPAAKTAPTAKTAAKKTTTPTKAKSKAPGPVR